MNKITIIILSVFILFVPAIISLNTPENIDLKEGKNNISMNLTKPIYVKELIKENPEISVVSYYNNNTSVGYVNVFGGVGKNFEIIPNEKYEVIVNKNMTLKIK